MAVSCWVHCSRVASILKLGLQGKVEVKSVTGCCDADATTPAVVLLACVLAGDWNRCATLANARTCFLFKLNKRMVSVMLGGDGSFTKILELCNAHPSAVTKLLKL